MLFNILRLKKLYYAFGFMMKEAAMKETQNIHMNQPAISGMGGSSRDKILAAVKNNQPALMKLPEVISFEQAFPNVVEKYTEVLKAIGGQVYEVSGYDEVVELIQSRFAGEKRIVSPITQLAAIAEAGTNYDGGHSLENVDVAILSVPLAVAENSAVWITDKLVPNRVLPFICQHLAVIVQKENIVASMHEAYDLIGSGDYGFGVFIAGPSKTADIEQSLVLGAHGPRSMTVFIMNEKRAD